MRSFLRAWFAAAAVLGLAQCLDSQTSQGSMTAAVQSLAPPARPAVLRVAPPATIQSAVDEAQPGDTIRIAAGSYVEQVIVTKDLTLDAEPGAILAAPPGPLQTFFDGGGQHAGVLTVHGADVLVRGLTVNGQSSGTPDYTLSGIFFLDAGGGAIGCHVIDVAAPGWPDLREDLSAFGISGINLDVKTPRNLKISDNLIERFNNFGIFTIGTGEDFAPLILEVAAERNVIRGAGPHPLVGQFGILVFRGATGSIRNNYIDEMGTPNYFTSEGGVGIHARFADGVVIEGNELFHIQIGIRCHNTNTARVAGNHVVGNAAGADVFGFGIICGGPGPRVIANNRIEGLAYSTDSNDVRVGIAAFGRDANVVDNEVEVIAPLGEAPNGPNAIAYFGDTGSIVGNTAHMPLSAPESGDYHVDPVVVLASGNGNAIVGNRLFGQREKPALYGIGFAGKNVSVVGNALADLPVGILEVNVDPDIEGLVTEDPKIQGNRFDDVGVQVQTQ
jgi:nitrous oxidase accessory protein NosD